MSAVSPKGDAPTAEVEELERSLLAAAAPGKASAFLRLFRYDGCRNDKHVAM